MSATNVVSAPRVIPGAAQTSELTLSLTPFDQRKYRAMIAARGETIRRVVGKLRGTYGLTSALDVGCGVGFFCQTLVECGLSVCGFDGRARNVAEARRRFPQIPFETANIEDGSVAELGRFDFVLCCGLLYHLENPLRAIRNLRALTDECLLVESMCIPGDGISAVLREEPNAEDQSLTDMAWYASENSLVKMLYRAGFAAVYRVTPLPNHEDFRETVEHARRRTMLLASSAPIDIAGFRLYPEPHDAHDPWRKAGTGRASLATRIRRFLASSRRKQYLTMALRARRIFPSMAIPLRLPFGAWWLAETGALDHELMYNGFEEPELRFVRRLLRPGMNALDVGAHHGLYTLLAAKLVGREGRVLAFEPSERENHRLARHIRVNRCRNVELVRCAASDRAGEQDFFVVEGFRDWGNSLRPPSVPDGVRKTRVETCRLDDVVGQRGIKTVDFIKVDTEGGELAVLRGAEKTLQTAPRPVVLAEVQDQRTHAWGYAAREITQLLARWKYRWFCVTEAGALFETSPDDEGYDANLVAMPEERLMEYRHLLEQPPTHEQSRPPEPAA